MTSLRAAVATAVLFTVSAATRADDVVPAYELPAGFDAPKLDAAIDDAVRGAVAAVRDPASAEGADDAVRVLAGVGRGALPRVVDALCGAGWHERAAFVAAVAEMDAPDATPLLVAASRDPAFSVREAAVVGLGKTGDARGGAALTERAAEETEPVWRVRAAAAAALRRCVLRRTLDRAAGETALVRLLADSDEDVRRAALREIAPLAADAALAAILGLYADPKTSPADRTLALTALRAYRSPKPELLAALRGGLLSGEDASEACEAGRALLAMRGVDALADEEVSAAVVRRLNEADHDALRDGLARLGRAVAPWLRARALDLASRIAAGRGSYDETPVEELSDTLIQVDETAGVALLKEILVGKDAGTFDDPTRRAVLRKVEVAFAPRLRTELRALFDAKVSDISADVLRAVVASGGDDLAARLDAALAGDDAADPPNSTAAACRTKLRAAAFDLLDRRTDLPAGPRLLALAEGAADAGVRRRALDALSRRDPERAAAIAASLVDDPRADMRLQAVSLLTASREPKDFDRLVARLAVEDGADARPPKAAAGGPATTPPAGTTPSEPSARLAQSRLRMVRELVVAIGMTGGDRARPVLLRVAETDPDAEVRVAAAQGLRNTAAAADAAKLVALESKETDPSARQELLRALAVLGDAPESVHRFETLVADSKTRPDALKLLAEPDSSVVTDGLAAGLADRTWTDDERRAALAALLRAGRTPDAAALAALFLDARTLDLAGDAAHALAGKKSPESVRGLLALLDKSSDPERLSAVVQALGELGAPETEAPLLDLFAKTRERAFAAASSNDPAVDLYRRCADAVADFGSERTGAAIAEHLLDPRLAHAAARCCAIAGGPFQPEEAAPVVVVRTLVAAFAHRDDAACGRLLAARLDALAADARDLALPEGFAAGVARYLEDPLAYRLPARPRPAAALLLWRLILKAAPRMSEFDVMAWQALDEHLGDKQLWREAGDALRAYRDLEDVENAARPREDRLVEDARIATRDALAAAADGRADEALAVARKLREPDATDGELAYREAWCLVRLGRADAEAADSLRFAAGQNDKDSRIHFWLGFVAERSDDPRSALKSYRQAVELDHRRVEERKSEEDAGYRGIPHDVAAYPYWYARSLRAAGRDREAFDHLSAAVALDDRLAAEALGDSAFFGWDKLDAAIADGLAKIRGGALR